MLSAEKAVTVDLSPILPADAKKPKNASRLKTSNAAALLSLAIKWGTQIFKLVSDRVN